MIEGLEGRVPCGDSCFVAFLAWWIKREVTADGRVTTAEALLIEAP